MPRITTKEFTPDGMMALIEDVERAAVQLRVVHDTMLAQKIGTKELPKASEAIKGIKALGTFVKAAQDEMTDHRLRIDRGT